MSTEDRTQELLDAAVNACGSNSEAIEAVRALASHLDAHVEDLQERVDELENPDDTVKEAVNRFCDVVERPVGTRDFTVPKTPEARRAILGLYDAINRNL